MNNIQLKEVIKESIREVLHEERLSLCESLIPYVSKKEMKEIILKYGYPQQYKRDEFIETAEIWIYEIDFRGQAYRN